MCKHLPCGSWFGCMNNKIKGIMERSWGLVSWSGIVVPEESPREAIGEGMASCSGDPGILEMAGLYDGHQVRQQMWSEARVGLSDGFVLHMAELERWGYASPLEPGDHESQMWDIQLFNYLSWFYLICLWLCPGSTLLE